MNLTRPKKTFPNSITHLIIFLGWLGSVEAKLPVVLLGDLHGHSTISDGKLPFGDVVKKVRDEGLDFHTIIEHTWYFEEGKEEIKKRDKKHKIKSYDQKFGLERLKYFNELYEAAKKEDERGTFTFAGLELYPSPEFGSLGFINFVPTKIPTENLEQFLNLLKNYPNAENVVAVIHHNGKLENKFSSKELGSYPFLDQIKNNLALMEIQCAAFGLNPFNLIQEKENLYLPLNEQYINSWLNLLKMGLKLGPVFSQCEHGIYGGSRTAGKTGALLWSKSREGLIKALKSRNVYASEDSNLRVAVAINDKHLPGDIIKTKSEFIDWKINVQDADEPQATYTIKVWSGPENFQNKENLLYEKSVTNISTISFKTPLKSRKYQILEIEQLNVDPKNQSPKNRVLFSPIWILPE